MSPTTKDATTNDHPVRPVANDTTDASGTPPVTAETKVHGALHGNPGATTTELAKAAGVGRSTAAKILARWAAEGVLIRTAGKDQRTPDTWTIPDTTDDADQTADDDFAATNEDDIPAEPGPSEIAETLTDGHTPPDALQLPEADAESVDSTSEQSSTATEIAPVVTSAPDDAAEEPDAVARDITTGDAAPDPVDSSDEPAVETASHDAIAVPTTTAAAAQKDRLPKGGLYDLVKAYLAEHPGDSFGPAKVGTDLSRSSGAVSNALDTLVVDGHALKTCEAPKRFAVKNGSADAE